MEPTHSEAGDCRVEPPASILVARLSMSHLVPLFEFNQIGIGKNVEVRDLFVVVTTSPLGTAFINFGREYPNQTFAGFIAAGSKIATNQWIAGLQGRIIGITGKIELHQGKPEIKVTSTDQIKLMQ